MTDDCLDSQQHCLNEAMLYVRRNERTNRVRVVIAY